MKTAKWMFWTLLAIFLWSVHAAEAGWGTKTWRSVRGARGSWSCTYNSRTYKSFSVDVPANAGSLTIRTGQDGRGGTGSLDLYVRYGRLPTSTSYLKRKIGPGYRKTITINNPRAGRYYIRIRGRTKYRTSIQARVVRKPVLTGMVLIPGGTNAGTDPDAGPYSLTVGSFYMDKYEVTKALWDEVKNWSGGNGYSYDTPGSGKAVNHPVYRVDWWDCVKWCNARSQKEGRTPVYYTDAAFTRVYQTGQVQYPYVNATANGYRLPTIGEWEYAARGGVANLRFPWGDTIQHTRANYCSSSVYSYDTSSTRGQHPAYDDDSLPLTSPVGSFAANGYGLYDMIGNLKEWCWDISIYGNSNHTYHGGGWGSVASGCRSSSFEYDVPGFADDRTGFRTVRSAGP